MQIWGTQPDAIDEAEDRDRWMDLLERLDIKQPPGTMATTEEGALAASSKCGCARARSSHDLHYVVDALVRGHGIPHLLMLSQASCDNGQTFVAFEVSIAYVPK